MTEYKTVGEIVHKAVEDYANTQLDFYQQMIDSYHPCTIECFVCKHYKHANYDVKTDEVCCIGVKCERENYEAGKMPYL